MIFVSPLHIYFLKEYFEAINDKTNDDKKNFHNFNF